MSNNPGMDLLLSLVHVPDLLGAVLDSSYDGIFITDGDGRVLYMNRACERLEGIEAASIVGKYMAELVVDGVYNDSVSLRVIRDGRAVTILQKTSGGREVMVSGTPVFSDGRLALVVTNERDVTELNDLSRKLEEHGRMAVRYEREIELLRAKNAGSMEGIIFRSKQMAAIIEVAMRVAAVDSTVLIQGESGVGKEVVAKLIYKHSGRFEGPFIDINCGAIPETLLESELFGYEEGAFTGARKGGKEGLFELADQGTLFLDEIGELPLSLQVKLLNFLQDRHVMRVGGSMPISVDVRIIAATNRDLLNEVKEGRFRSDLFYRLSVVPIVVPPLRQRKDDIEPLVKYFQSVFLNRYGLGKTISPAAMKILMNYEWPGNVRELENLIERLVLTCPDEIIYPEHLGGYLTDIGKIVSRLVDGGVMTLHDASEKFERIYMKEMSRHFKGTTDMARALGVDRSTIIRKMKKYGIAQRDK